MMLLLYDQKFCLVKENVALKSTYMYENLVVSKHKNGK